MRRSEESGMRISHPTVWASAPKAYQAAYATPGDALFGGLLQFKFQPGDQVYTELVSKPGLTASVWIDSRRTVSSTRISSIVGDEECSGLASKSPARRLFLDFTPVSGIQGCRGERLITVSC